MKIKQIRSAASIAAMVVTLIAIIDISESQAGKRTYPGDGAYPFITVTSQYDPTFSYSAPVRRSSRGDEVRLPGGTWVRCGINCYNTLRAATVDYWRRYDGPVTLP